MWSALTNLTNTVVAAGGELLERVDEGAGGGLTNAGRTLREAVLGDASDDEGGSSGEDEGDGSDGSDGASNAHTVNRAAGTDKPPRANRASASAPAAAAAATAAGIGTLRPTGGPAAGGSASAAGGGGGGGAQAGQQGGRAVTRRAPVAHTVRGAGVATPRATIGKRGAERSPHTLRPRSSAATDSTEPEPEPSAAPLKPAARGSHATSDGGAAAADDTPMQAPQGVSGGSNDTHTAARPRVGSAEASAFSPPRAANGGDGANTAAAGAGSGSGEEAAAGANAELAEARRLAQARLDQLNAFKAKQREFAAKVSVTHQR